MRAFTNVCLHAISVLVLAWLDACIVAVIVARIASIR